MVKRMLIDATHPEETRVVVLDGTRLDEFDVETSTKKQIKGNIYLAKVVRVEPSLQAAFVDYGGNRHGFLAFSEIHPDYYQIPVADRERLLAEAARHEEEEDRRERERHQRRQTREASSETAGSGEQPAMPQADFESSGGESTPNFEQPDSPDVTTEAALADHGADSGEDVIPLAFIPPAISAPPVSDDDHDHDHDDDHDDDAEDTLGATPADEAEAAAEGATAETSSTAAHEMGDAAPEAPVEVGAGEGAGEEGAAAPDLKQTVETIGGEYPEDEEEEESDKQRRRFVASRHYKIQEVIKRRQIMLVQVVKEERGNKGAALTTYLSLAGRYCVLMPNSARGGGVSRKITSAQDRRRLKQIVGDLELPKNMAVILRTAGAERSRAEIKRDYEYLQRTWNNIREVTMQSRAPALIHEEASLIKRAIRDIYSRDIEEIWVEGDEGYKVAKDFMRMLTPSHAKKVQRYKDDLIPMFHRYQVESQMETINSPVVQLRSGGSIVFGQTEALVAIDVNSGRATRERHIEETAYKTNVEAAEEIARQLRLRDLAGLVVIDFIDMEDNRNNHAVERRLKEALKSDRARIQVGRISHFGLLELSRQRLRPSLIETNFRVCHHCAGTGLLRSTESAAVHTLRMIEEEGVRRRSSELTVTVNPDVAIYLLNYKRDMIAAAELRYGVKVFILGDASLVAPNLRIDRIKATRPLDEHGEPIAPPQREMSLPVPVIDEEDDIEDEEEEDQEEERQEQHAQRADRDGQRGERGERGERDDGEGGRRRRRRRRRRRGERGDGQGQAHHEAGGAPAQADEQAPADMPAGETEGDDDVDDASGDQPHQEQHAGDGRDGEGRRGRRRGRRGGRRRRRGGENGDGREGGHPPAEGGHIADAYQSPFPPDHTHPAAPDVHVDETYEAPHVTFPAATQEPAEQGNGEKRGFFRALKEGALGWRRNDAPVSETPQPVVAVQPEPPRTAPVVEAPPPPPPPPVEEEPAGPPRKGWWQQPNKAE
jgi:ribonuclease E